MKRNKTVLSIVLAVMLALSCCPVAIAANVGTTYYVDSVNGDDANRGTSESAAWKTTEKAASVEYSAGDKVLFKAGGYFVGTFSAKGSGTEENPITLGSYGDVEALGKPMLTVEGDNAVAELKDVSNWVINGLDVSAPDGRGIYVICTKAVMSGITVENCSMHDIFKQRSQKQVLSSHASIGINSVGQGKLCEVSVCNIDIKDCGYGIWSGGNDNEWSKTYYVSPEKSYTENVIYENVTMSNVYYDGIAIGSMYNLIIRNCVLINTSLYEDFYTAPTWMHHAKNVLIENCEIAGSTNTMDGMAVDFDGWTTDSTYQYIYSHDNVRFIQNCVYDDETQNRNCTVRYCLSVNDGKELNRCSQMLGENATVGMDNFKFYNNTIVDAANFDFSSNINSTVANNIFISTKPFGEFQIIKNYSNIGLHKFSGSITNNCFVNYAVPTIAKKNAIAIPGFVGGDYYDVNSYRLSASSPLVGKGIQVEDDMGEHDFYGNALTDKHNIGCFDAPGIEDGKTISVMQKMQASFKTMFYKLYGAILSLINRF